MGRRPKPHRKDPRSPAVDPRAPYNLGVHQWAERHNLNIGMASMAQQIAAGAGEVYELATLLRSTKLDPHLPGRPAAADWLELYRDHRRVWRTVSKSVGPLHGMGGAAFDDGEEMLALSRFQQQYPDEWNAGLKRIGQRKLWNWIRRGFRLGAEGYREHLRRLRRNFAGKDDGEADAFERDVQQPEVLFFFSVVIPSFVAYTSSPWRLIRQARNGNIDAIESLVRLDPAVLQDGRIAHWLNDGSSSTRRFRRESVGVWMQEGVKARLTRAGVKNSMAGLISLVGEFLALRFNRHWKLERYELSARQISELFDAVARDSGGAESITNKDSSTGGINLESWQKAIQRHKRAWRHGLPVTIKPPPVD